MFSSLKSKHLSWQVNERKHTLLEWSPFGFSFSRLSLLVTGTLTDALKASPPRPVALALAFFGFSLDLVGVTGTGLQVTA